LAFFAYRFSFSDLLAAVFELFEPPLSLLAMATSSGRDDRVLTVSPRTDRLDAEERTRARCSRGADGGRPGTRTSRGSCIGGTSRTSPGGTMGRRPRPRLRSCPRKTGRAVLRGRPLRGPPCKHTDLFDQPCDRPHHLIPPHRGLPRFRALAAALRCSRYAPKWALTAGG